MPKQPAGYDCSRATHAAKAVDVNGTLFLDRAVDRIENVAHRLDRGDVAIDDGKAQAIGPLSCINRYGGKAVFVTNKWLALLIDFISFHQVDDGSNAGLEQPFESLLMVTRIRVTCVSSAEKQVFDDPVRSRQRRWAGSER